MDDAFETDLDRLAALQAIDHGIKDWEGRAQVLRKEVEDVDAAVRARQEEVEQLAFEQRDLEKQRLELEERLRTEEQKIKGSRMRMTRIRNERELLAMQHEINVAKEALQQIEEQLLSVMERSEDVGARLAKARAALAEGQIQSAEAAHDRRVALEEAEREVAARRQQREILLRGMDESLRAKYEQILSRRGGMAVVEVRNGTCLGCHMHVPPQLFNELQKFRDVRQCPNCHRILYWKPEKD